MIAAWGLIVVEVVMHECGSLRRNGVQHTSSHRIGVGEALSREVLAVLVTRFFHIESIIVIVTADARYIMFHLLLAYRGLRPKSTRTGS